MNNITTTTITLKGITTIFLVCILYSCTGSDPRSAELLKHARYVMDEHSDSSLLYLDSISAPEENLNTSDYMRYLISRVEAMNKLYIPIDTVSYMARVTDYYASNGTAHDKTKAYYLLGSVYRDRGDAHRAISFFKDAVSVHYQEYKPSDYLLISHAYGQMAWLYEELRYPRQSLNMRDKRIEYALKAGDTIVAVQSYDYKSGLYLTMGMADSAMYVSKKAYRYFKENGYSDIAAGILPTQINYYLGTDSIEKAGAAIEEYVNSSGLVNPETKEMKSPEQMSFYNDWALYYQKTGRPDSALYFYNKAMKVTDDASLRRTYRGLISLYSSLNKSDSVLKYNRLYTNITDSLYLHNSTDEIARIEALYDYTESEEKAILKSQEADRLRLTIYLITAVFIALIIIAYTYIRRQRERKKYELSLANQKYSEALYMYCRAENEIKSLNTDLNDFKLQKSAELKHLREILSSYQDNVNSKEWSIEQTLMQHAAVTQLHSDAAHARTATDIQWGDLEAVISKFIPDFYRFLEENKVRINYKEYRLCMLARLNFIPSEVATLMDLTKQNVSNMRSSANRKLFGQSGSRTFDENIHKQS